MNDFGFLLNYQYFDGKSEFLLNAHQIKNRILPFCVAVSVIDGEYFVTFDDETVCAKAGETIFIQSFVKHSIEMKKSGKLTFAHFLCSYAGIDIFSLAKQKRIIADNKNFLETLNCLSSKKYADDVLQKVHTDKILCELLLKLFDMNFIAFETLSFEPWLNNTLKYIHSNIQKGITIQDVISVSGYAKTNFYKMFKNRMNVSPRKYIESEKFRIASVLLLEGKKTTDVSIALGFNDVSYFNKVFKRTYGLTPVEYKRKMNYSKGELL